MTGMSFTTSPLYSEDLGIDLAQGGEDACFRWFLASTLYGGRISGTIARHTYQSFDRHGLTSPQAILQAGWDYLVNPVMREGGYVRYDESKSRRLLADCSLLLEKYGGRVGAIHEAATGPGDLEARLRQFPGFGPVTINIFLRELRPFWPKADPAPLSQVFETAAAIGVGLPADRKSMDFVRAEAGLIRHAHGGR
jgi:hypothetical protein